MKKIAFILPALLLSIPLTAHVVSAGGEKGQLSVIDVDPNFDEEHIEFAFAGVTDCHFSSSSSDPETQFRKTIQWLKEVNGNKDLSALLVGGDMVDTTWTTTGTNLADFTSFSNCVKDIIDPAKTALFYTFGNHDIDPTSTRGADVVNVPSYYFNILGKEYFQFDDNYEAMFDAQGKATNAVTKNRSMHLGGYSFISIAPEYFWNPDGAFSAETLKFLKDNLDAAVAEDATKPIFVMSHSAITNSVRGSADWEYTYRDLEGVLASYPQVVYLSGHVHNMITDEASIQQRAFTMLDLGTTKYSNSADNYADGSPSWSNYKGYVKYDNARGTIAASSAAYFEIDNNHNLRVRRLFIDHGENTKAELDPWYIDAPKADGSHLNRYNYEHRYALNEAPVWDEKLLLSSVIDGSVNITFASASDDKYVEYYQVNINTIYGQEIRSYRFMTNYYRFLLGVKQSPYHIQNIGTLPAGEYVVTLFAGDCFHALSEPIELVVVIE